MPDCVGLPASVPLADNDNPGGSPPPKPDTNAHVKGGENAPPDAVKVFV